MTVYLFFNTSSIETELHCYTYHLQLKKNHPNTLILSIPLSRTIHTVTMEGWLVWDLAGVMKNCGDSSLRQIILGLLCLIFIPTTSQWRNLVYCLEIFERTEISDLKRHRLSHVWCLWWKMIPSETDDFQAKGCRGAVCKHSASRCKRICVSSLRLNSNDETLIIPSKCTGDGHLYLNVMQYAYRKIPT